jgi:ubiquinone/menaquinone biosynthesis C-methylase UbiE
MTDWQQDAAAPELYERHLVPAITAVWAADLIARSAIVPGERVLDVACGTGIVASLAAERVGSSGHVAGLDINSAMLAVARRKQPSAGASAIEWVDGSALAMPFDDAQFDVVLCQLGLQFFPDQPRALAEMRRALRPGGRCALSVFGPIENTPAAHALVDALDAVFGPTASLTKRSEHQLADPALLRALFKEAAFEDIRIEPVVQIIRFPSVRDYAELQIVATPMAALVADRSEPERNALIDAVAGKMANALRAFTAEGGLAFPQEAYVATARHVNDVRS